MIQLVRSSVEEALGTVISEYKPVHGGDISQSWKLTAGGQIYFLKVNSAGQYPGMFALEQQGLDALRTNGLLRLPLVIATATSGVHQWLLLEWIERGPATAAGMQKLGIALAAQHRSPQAAVGWHSNNYIGSLVQVNTRFTSWQTFYAACRILPLVQQLFDAKAFGKQDAAQAEQFCRQLDSIFPPEPPALLHGDLWSGNFCVDSTGEPVVFDPAVYCGHREMDLGMTRLFGGFAASFYDAYADTYPLAPGWEQRLPAVQLYPVLVHAVLFGGQYIQHARQIISSY